MKSLLVLLLLATNSLHAASKDSTQKMMPMEMTAEQRVNMATAHENMAACLRSDKSPKDCHAEMRLNCKNTMGNDGCGFRYMDDEKRMKKRK